ncbi:MAG: TM1812 family CRISPR-associated protein [Candidatus Bathyarchaeia archaeon]
MLLMRLLVYQLLGRLNGYENVVFQVEGKNHGPLRLSSFAISRQFLWDGGADEAEARLIVPINLEQPSTVDGSKLDLTHLHDSLMYKLKKTFEEDKQLDRFKLDVMLIPAIGTYDHPSGRFTYDSTPQSIAAKALIEMLKDIKKVADDKTTIIVDVSTGWNGYMPSVLDALRALIVLDKLEGGLKNRRISEAYYAVAEPVFRDIRKEFYKISLVKYDVKAFMSLPLNGVNEAIRAGNIAAYFPGLNNDEKEKFNRELRNEVELSRLLCNALAAFNTLQHNAPLALCDSNIVELDSAKAEQAVERLLEFFERKLQPTVSDKRVFVPDIDFKTFVNTLISLSIYYYISKLMENSKLEKTSDGHVNADSLLKVFEDVYNWLGMPLNSRFLRIEIQKLKEKDLKLPEPKAPNHKTSDQIRNFFAHAGLSHDVTQLHEESDKIYVKYKENVEKTIRRWLENPL